jgi:hypothetical protein
MKLVPKEPKIDKMLVERTLSPGEEGYLSHSARCPIHCGDEAELGFVCTREPKHTGRHAAHGYPVEIQLASWD